ncbi:MAG: hypothetical protein HQL82_10845 [Magnetococcales bacterium]|nr:hypothetical protein [Magnetococcales bacterium]
MPFDGNGTFNRVHNWEADKAQGLYISAARMDEELDGFATGLTQCLTRGGQSPPTTDLPMAGQRHTGVGNASARTHYAAVGQVQDNAFTYAPDTGSANACVIGLSPAVTAYGAGQHFRFKAAQANTGAATLDVNGLGARAILGPGGRALGEGEIPAGGMVEVIYDGTAFQLTGGGRPSSGAGDSVIINGNFAVWQRATSFTPTGTAYTADRHQALATAAAGVTVTRQAFACGQTAVPGEPAWYWQLTRTTANGDSIGWRYLVEDCRTLAGGAATLCFWYKGDAPSNGVALTVGVWQVPKGSATVQVCSNTITLSGAWQKALFTLNMPNLVGASLGDDHHVRLEISGANWAGELSLAQIRLAAGTVEPDMPARGFGAEQLLCFRYFWAMGHRLGNVMHHSVGFVNRDGTGGLWVPISLPVVMRVTPTGTVLNPTKINLFQANNNHQAIAANAGGAGTASGFLSMSTATSVLGVAQVSFWGFSDPQCEIQFDAEL